MSESFLRINPGYIAMCRRQRVEKHPPKPSKPKAYDPIQRRAKYVKHRSTILARLKEKTRQKREGRKPVSPQLPARLSPEERAAYQQACQEAGRKLSKDLQREAAQRLPNATQVRFFKQIHSARRHVRMEGARINDLTKKQWLAIQAAYHYRCVYCGCKPAKLTKDHITPLFKGGNHTVSNVVPASKRCNSRKHTGPPPVPVQPLLFAI